MNWNCRGKILPVDERIFVMGIINVTPDSFSDGGCFCDAPRAVAHALSLEEEGADILDFGAQSTRPGYREIPPEEEWKRLQPVLKEVRKKTALPISVDTYFPYVAKRALEEGADIINDVSGRVTAEMAALVKNSGAGWVIMHNGEGGPQEVLRFFKASAAACAQGQVPREQLCFDMGIGFGKSYEQNLALLGNVKEYRLEGYPLLLGTSRKRVIARASGVQQPSERIYGNIAADTAAILGGVNIIRIHDVKNEIKGIRTAQEIKKWIK